jgi:hypothetical protein
MPSIKPQSDRLIRVIRVVLTVNQPLPVYPDEGTSSEPVGMFQTCQTRKSLFSFYHLVGAGEQQRWNGQAKRFARFQVDHELELDRGLNR